MINNKENLAYKMRVRQISDRVINVAIYNAMNMNLLAPLASAIA